VVLNADNSVMYTPTAGTTATTDTFTYSISDGYGGTASATVTVFLTNPGPIANQVNAATPANTPVTMNVLVNDYHPEGDSISVTAVGTPSTGTAVLNADGTVTYTPPNPLWTGTATFTYTISDSYGGSATATVSVTVGSVSQVKASDVYDATYLNGAIAIDVLTNAYNSTAYGLTVTSVGSGTNGSVTSNSDGTLSYTPTPGTTATSDTFTYTISDGHGDTSTATIHLTLEH
jgi:hypothetical protein